MALSIIWELIQPRRIVLRVKLTFTQTRHLLPKTSQLLHSWVITTVRVRTWVCQAKWISARSIIVWWINSLKLHLVKLSTVLFWISLISHQLLLIQRLSPALKRLDNPQQALKELLLMKVAPGSALKIVPIPHLMLSVATEYLEKLERALARSLASIKTPNSSSNKAPLNSRMLPAWIASEKKVTHPWWKQGLLLNLKLSRQLLYVRVTSKKGKSRSLIIRILSLLTSSRLPSTIRLLRIMETASKMRWARQRTAKLQIF